MDHFQTRAITLIAGNGAVLATVLNTSMRLLEAGMLASERGAVAALALGLGALAALGGVGAAYRALVKAGRADDRNAYLHWEKIALITFACPIVSFAFVLALTSK